MISLFVVLGLSSLALAFLEEVVSGKYAIAFSIVIFFTLYYISIVSVSYFEDTFNCFYGWVVFKITELF